jgi:AcrR family transcriptional regulator
MKINLAARALAGERKRLKTRAVLLDAAMRVIAAKGPHAASIDEFTAQAGVSRGTFYNYFPTLDELVLALTAEVFAALDQRLDESLGGLADPVERLARACLIFIDMGVSDPIWGWVFLRLDASSVPRVAQVHERFAVEFERGLAAGRFQPASLAAGYSLTAGGVRMAVRSILSGAEPACGAETVRLILVGLGVAPAEAAQLCQGPA